jgi:uncharacterized repeat protein (TIGR03803 family)
MNPTCIGSGQPTCGGVYGDGTVFELTLNQRGNWIETIIHNFGSATDGRTLFSSLVLDSSGNLYGTTNAGGANGVGTVFELTLGANGWAETILYDFGSTGADASHPYAGLIFDSSGSLYGTTLQGGHYGGGTVFQLSNDGQGHWTAKTLHSFGGFEDGIAPYGGVVFDPAGNLYGTTESSGPHYPWLGGTLFELTPQTGGEWTETLLQRFAYQVGNPFDGFFLDAFGNLYAAGYYNGVFELIPQAGGGWSFKGLGVNNSFLDSLHPYGGVIVDSSGNVYGTALYGGTHGYGTVFEITP